MLPMPRELEEGHYLVMATRRGLIKRTETTEFANLRSTGLIAIVLREDDDLIGVALTDGSRDVLLGSKQGMAIRFSESEMRPSAAPPWASSPWNWTRATKWWT